MQQNTDAIIVYRSPSEKLIAEGQYEISMAIGNFFWDNWQYIIGGILLIILLIRVIDWFQRSIIRGQIRR